MSSSSAAIHCSPSRQGVHQPHDSWAKNCIMLSVMPTGQVWSSSSTSVPVPRRLWTSSMVEKPRGTSILSAGTNEGRGAARADGAQRVPGQHAAGVHLDELPHRHAHRELEAAGVGHAAGDAEDLGAALVDDGEALPPVHAVPHDGGHGHVGLDVVDDGRPREQPGAGHVRRPRARVGPLALERVQHRRRLAADVAADARVQLDVEREAGAEDVLARGSRARGLRRSPA